MHSTQVSNRPGSTYPLPEGPRMAVTALVGKLIYIFCRICLPVLVFTEETAQYPPWAVLSYPAISVILLWLLCLLGDVYRFLFVPSFVRSFVLSLLLVKGSEVCCDCFIMFFLWASFAARLMNSLISAKENVRLHRVKAALGHSDEKACTLYE